MSGFVVFHKENAGRPESFEGGPWFFEPSSYECNDVYSVGYATKEAAENAAAEWESRQDQTA